MKIGVNCGHTVTGAGSGAVGSINEGIETRNVGNILMGFLKNNGHQVFDCTVNKAISQIFYLKQTVTLANQQELDYFISIHFNAGGGLGTEVYTYKGKQLDMALKVSNNIASLGFKNRGIKDGTKLYVIKKTKAKSVLIEVCFVDSEDANKYITLGPNKIAEAICQAICNEITNNEYDNWIARLQQEINKQYLSGLKIDGLNGPKTLAMCPTVKMNSKGNITSLIQERLNSVGFNISKDGIFGQKTRNAIKVFQRNRGLKEDGIVGRNTWKYLLSGKRY